MRRAADARERTHHSAFPEARNPVGGTTPRIVILVVSRVHRETTKKLMTTLIARESARRTDHAGRLVNSSTLPSLLAGCGVARRIAENGHVEKRGGERRRRGEGEERAAARD